jgi:asparagine synthase (glutamine-hydrolysing)
MYRIVGFIDFNFNNSYSLEETITLMRDTLIHGGPDDAGIFIDKDFPVALGHRRLSILDLSSLGHQPMEFENLVITYNGEVYNFKEIRKELEKEGYKFISNSDTEVILKAFHRWGFSAVHKFRGMFAFALWDKKDKKLILCRDRIGVKPLYYYYKNGLFMFVSELKAFHKFFNYLFVVVYKLGITGICLGTFFAYTFLCGVSYVILIRKLKVG